MKPFCFKNAKTREILKAFDEFISSIGESYRPLFEKEYHDNLLVDGDLYENRLFNDMDHLIDSLARHTRYMKYRVVVVCSEDTASKLITDHENNHCRINKYLSVVRPSCELSDSLVAIYLVPVDDRDEEDIQMDKSFEFAICKL